MCQENFIKRTSRHGGKIKKRNSKTGGNFPETFFGWRLRRGQRQRKQNELSTRAGVSGGGSFFAGSQIIPYASTAARLTALQKSGLSRRDAALFDQAERERSMAGQQRFVRRGGKRRTYG